MSRNRKPVEQSTRHSTNAEKQEKRYSEQKTVVGKNQLKRPNKDLFVNGDAEKEYKRVIKEFDKVELVGNLDLVNLIGYANSYAKYIACTRQLATEPLLVEDKENPLIGTQIKYAEEMRKFARLCGLTIDSRLKIATYKTSQEKEQLADDFGDI